MPVSEWVREGDGTIEQCDSMLWKGASEWKTHIAYKELRKNFERSKDIEKAIDNHNSITTVLHVPIPSYPNTKATHKLPIYSHTPSTALRNHIYPLYSRNWHLPQKVAFLTIIKPPAPQQTNRNKHNKRKEKIPAQTPSPSLTGLQPQPSMHTKSLPPHPLNNKWHYLQLQEHNSSLSSKSVFPFLPLMTYYKPLIAGAMRLSNALSYRILLCRYTVDNVGTWVVGKQKTKDLQTVSFWGGKVDFMESTDSRQPLCLEEEALDWNAASYSYSYVGGRLRERLLCTRPNDSPNKCPWDVEYDIDRLFQRFHIFRHS